MILSPTAAGLPYVTYRESLQGRNEVAGQVEAEEVSNSRNEIHQTWERHYRDSLHCKASLAISPRLPTEVFFYTRNISRQAPQKRDRYDDEYRAN